MKDTDYLHIPGWVYNLKLASMNEMLIFSLIHGFTKDGEAKFTGSAKYIAEWTLLNPTTIYSILKKLTEEGFLIKEETYVNNVKFCAYSVGTKDSYYPSERLTTGTQATHYNNTSNNASNTSFVSKDTHSVSDEPAKKSSKLFSAKTENLTEKNKWINSKIRLLDSYDFSEKIGDMLVGYFENLAEQKAFLTEVTIRMQLDMLAKLKEAKQKEVVELTIARGWRSLDYVAQDSNKFKGKKSTFDTDAVCQLKDENSTRKEGEVRNPVPNKTY